MTTYKRKFSSEEMFAPIIDRPMTSNTRIFRKYTVTKESIVLHLQTLTNDNYENLDNVD